MKKIVSVLLLVSMCVVMVCGLTSCSSKPERVHMYGSIILGNEYVEGNVCFKVSDYDKSTNRVKIKGLERYGWITLFNYDFYSSNESCPYCGHRYATIH